MRQREASAERDGVKGSDRPVQLSRRSVDAPRRRRALLCFAAGLVGFSLLAAERVTGMLGVWPGAAGGDRVSAREAQARSERFVAARPLPLAAVAPDDLPQALRSMALPADAQRALVAELEQQAGTSAHHRVVAESFFGSRE